MWTSDNLARLALIVLVLVSILRLSQRSIGLDEGMLLTNLFHAGGLQDLFGPMPFYDQAQPVLASAFHQAMLFVTEDVWALRVMSAMAVGLSSVLSIRVLRAERAPWLAITLAAGAFLGPLAYYATEIKHYALELVQAFFLVYTFHLFYQRRITLQAFAVIAAISAFLGFSTLIPTVLSIAFCVALQLRTSGTSAAMVQWPGLAVSAVLLALNYLSLKYLTREQLEVPAYASDGLLADLGVLAVALGSAHGGVISVIALVIALVSILARRGSRFAVRLGLLFIAFCVAILLGKMTGVYPVISARHVIWTTPFALTLVGLFLATELQARGKTPLVLVVGGLCSIAAFWETGRIMIDDGAVEFADNEALYRHLASLPPQEIGLYPYAVPSLDYYARHISGLERHTYIGRRVYPSGTRFDQAEFDGLAEGLEGIEGSRRLYVVSHLPSSVDPPDAGTRRVNRLEDALRARGCAWSEEFAGRRVSLLMVYCRPEPSR